MLCQVEVKRPVSIPALFRLLTASDHCTDPCHIQLSMHANSTLTDPVGAHQVENLTSHISYLLSPSRKPIRKAIDKVAALFEGLGGKAAKKVSH